MALKPCRECAKEVSTDAQACPHCGTVMPTKEVTREWVPCPNCGSAKTKRYGPGTVAFASIIGASCAVWIPIVGWIMIPFLVVIAIGATIMAVLPSGKVGFQCEDCKKWFTVSKQALPVTPD